MLAEGRISKAKPIVTDEIVLLTFPTSIQISPILPAKPKRGISTNSIQQDVDGETGCTHQQSVIKLITEVGFRHTCFCFLTVIFLLFAYLGGFATIEHISQQILTVAAAVVGLIS